MRDLQHFAFQKTEIVSGTLPLLVLRTLESFGSLRGSELAHRIERISGEALQVNRHTLPAALADFERQGWITSRWGSGSKNRKAKYYSITIEGKKRLRNEIAIWYYKVSRLTRFLQPVSPDSTAELAKESQEP